MNFLSLYVTSTHAMVPWYKTKSKLSLKKSIVYCQKSLWDMMWISETLLLLSVWWEKAFVNH